MEDFIHTTGNLKEHVKKPLLKIIREKCLDCCVHQYSEVRSCPITSCSLWPYRMGKNPFHVRRMTEAKKREASQRLRDGQK